MKSAYCSIPLACALLLGAGIATAADIYRWVDKDGRTQLSDKVPEEYKDKAVKIERAREPTAEQKRLADERLARDRAKAGIGVTQPAAAAASAASAPRAAAPAGDACSQAWAAFNQAQACFAPFRLANGGLKEGAIAKCGQGGVQPSCPQPQN